MTENKPTDIVTGDTKALVEARSSQIKTANRLWMLAASTTLFVVSAKTSEDNSVRFLGFIMDAEFLYPIAAVILALLNIAYCTSGLSSYRLADILHEHLSRMNAFDAKFSKSFTVADVVYSMHAEALFRPSVIMNIFPARLRAVVYLILKSISDLTFTMVPISGIVVSFVKMDSLSLSIISFISLPAIALSFICTCILLWVSFKFTLINIRSMERPQADGRTGR